MRQLMVLMASVCVLLGQGTAPGGSASAPVSVVNNLPAQKIGPNDLLNVSVYGAPELSRTVRVGQDGNIRMPMLKTVFSADGKLPGEMEATIAGALDAEKILVDPVVTVTVAEYVSRPISVMGAVKQPLTFQAYGPVTLIDALSRAGGLTQESGAEILLSRTQRGPDGKPATLTQRIPVKQLVDAADPELNYSLRGGEEIRVPDAAKIFVVGNVKKPGSFPIRESMDTTVLKVLALSEGLLPFANSEAYIYRREGAENGRNEIPIPLSKIIDRKSPDIPLLANDVLYIPDNKRKRLTTSTIDRIVTFGAGTASGMLVWRR